MRVLVRGETIDGMSDKYRGFLGCFNLRRSKGSEYARGVTYATKKVHSNSPAGKKMGLM